MISPTKGRVVLKKIDRDDIKTGAGVLLPGEVLQEEALCYGLILDHNPSDDSTQTFTAGQKVFYSRYSATRVTNRKGENEYIVSDLDIMGVDHDDPQTV